MQGRRSGSRRKLSKTYGQKHKAKQKDSSRTRQNLMLKYLNRKIVEELHAAIIAETHDQVPERSHVLNPSALELALELPKKCLYGQELYPDLFDKASVLMRELIRGHAFEAANKRTGYMAALTFLDENGYDLESTVDEAKLITTEIAMDKVDVKEVAKWLRKHSKPKTT
jgi:death-on-curing protein